MIHTSELARQDLEIGVITASGKWTGGKSYRLWISYLTDMFTDVSDVSYIFFDNISMRSVWH